MASGILLLASFLLFMLFFAGVGLASMMVKEDTTDDYLVAGRGMHPALAALSAVSTWNSGYMFIGFIGFIFLNGYSAIWIALVSLIKSEDVLGFKPKLEFIIAFSISGIKLLSQGEITRDLPSSTLILAV